MRETGLPEPRLPRSAGSAPPPARLEADRVVARVRLRLGVSRAAAHQVEAAAGRRRQRLAARPSRARPVAARDRGLWVMAPARGFGARSLLAVVLLLLLAPCTALYTSKDDVEVLTGKTFDGERAFASAYTRLSSAEK